MVSFKEDVAKHLPPIDGCGSYIWRKKRKMRIIMLVIVLLLILTAIAFKN
jgi:hypothetical protein